jgi:hypothetical protein
MSSTSRKSGSIKAASSKTAGSSPAAIAAEFGAAGRARAEAALLQSSKLLSGGGGLDGFFSDDEDQDDGDNRIPGNTRVEDKKTVMVDTVLERQRTARDHSERFSMETLGALEVENVHIKLEVGADRKITSVDTDVGLATGLSQDNSFPGVQQIDTNGTNLNVDEIRKIISSWDLFGAKGANAGGGREGAPSILHHIAGASSFDEDPLYHGDDLGELAVCFKSPGEQSLRQIYRSPKNI